MENVLTTIIDNLVPLVITALGGVLTWIGTKIKTYYEEKAKDEKVKAVINSTVKYVEQVYKDLGGVEKLAKAKESALELLSSKGITITDIELTILIESFVNGLKTETKEETE